MTQYIIRNGGFQKKQMMLEKPEPLKTGAKLHYLRGDVSTLKKGKEYKVINHFCYLNTYGAAGKKFAMWDEFVTVKNEFGEIIKVSKRKFDVVPTDIMEILNQTI